MRTGFKTGIRVERFRKIYDTLRIEGQARGLRETADALPALAAAAERFRPAQKGDFAVTQPVQVFEREAGAAFVVHGNRAYFFKLEFPSRHDGGHLPLR